MDDTIKLINKTKVSLVRGDITRQSVDAIVNAANSSLLGGGGVDGAIHRAGGPQILEECKEIRRTQGTCPAGQAVITSGGKLPAKFVIHAVGPIWHGGTDGEAETLAGAYNNSLKLAVEAAVGTVAFPSISTGAYGYPVDKAASVALSAIKSFCERDETLNEIRMVLFDERSLETYKRVLARITA